MSFSPVSFNYSNSPLKRKEMDVPASEEQRASKIQAVASAPFAQAPNFSHARQLEQPQRPPPELPFFRPIHPEIPDNKESDALSPGTELALLAKAKSLVGRGEMRSLIASLALFKQKIKRNSRTQCIIAQSLTNNGFLQEAQNVVKTAQNTPALQEDPVLQTWFSNAEELFSCMQRRRQETPLLPGHFKRSCPAAWSPKVLPTIKTLPNGRIAFSLPRVSFIRKGSNVTTFLEGL